MYKKKLIAADKNKDEAEVFKVSIFRLTFIGLIVITPAITPGMAIVFSAIAQPQMNLNLDDASWFASITALSCPFGCFIGGAVIDRFGRRVAMFSSIAPSIVGWFLLADAKASFATLLIGRLLTGLAVGGASLPPIIYVSECITVNHHSLRGSLGTWSNLAYSIGTLATYALGTLMPYNQVAFTAACISVLSFFLILAFIPESPCWLHTKGRFGDAEISQKRLGIKQPILQNRKIVRGPAADAANIDLNVEMYSHSLIEYLENIKRREVYKPLVITVVFLFFAQFSGFYCVTSYMVEVISVGSVTSNSYLLSTMGGIFQLVGNVALNFILPRTGIKLLSVISIFGITAGFILLAFSEISLFASILHVTSIYLIMFTAGLGVCSLPYSILGEMFPMGAKGYASLSLVGSSIFNFIILKMYPYMYAMYGSHVYFGFAFINLCGVVFVVTCLPETVGKTMDEIGNAFKKKTIAVAGHC